MLLSPGARLGHYDVTALLGEGASPACDDARISQEAVMKGGADRRRVTLAEHRVLRLSVFLLMCLSVSVQVDAQDRVEPMAATVLQTFRMVERSFVSGANAMPADKWTFKPADGEFGNVRTFAEQVKPEVAAQTATPSDSTPPGPGSAVSVRYEIHRDRLRYRFENPSSFDTGFLVPHEFTQGYVADNQWLVVSARFPFRGDRLEMEFGFTPETTTSGDDFDTFFNPDGDVILSGYEADVSMRSLRFALWSYADRWTFQFRAGYTFRRDRAHFHPVTERLLRHSNPPSESRTLIDLQETTISQVHDFAFGVAKRASLGSAWALVAGADASPTLARLTTILPLKYPGSAILFQAPVVALTGRVELVWLRWRWPVVFMLNHGRTWSYRSSAQFSRDTLQFAVQLATGL